MIITVRDYENGDVATIRLVQDDYSTDYVKDILNNCKYILLDVDDLNDDDYDLNNNEIEYIQENFGDGLNIDNLLELANYLHFFNYTYELNADLDFII